MFLYNQRVFSLRPSLTRLLFGSSPQTYNIRRRVNHSPELMFQVVSKVDLYKEFVPFVTESFVNRIDNHGHPSEAGFRVGWRQFDESFTCIVHCEHNPSNQVARVKSESVTMSLFRSLTAEWVLLPISGSISKSSGCEVALSLEYEFKNPMYQAASAMFSETATKVMIRAFEKRARDLMKEEKKDMKK